MKSMTLQELKDKLQNLCYQGHSQRKVLTTDFEKECFSDATDIEYQLLNGDSIYIALTDDNRQPLGD